MDCFVDYIGLKDCSQEVPESGFYINDMSGMSLKRLDKISDSERQTYIGVWDRVQSRAALEIGDRIRNKFLSYWKPSSPIETAQFGYFDGQPALSLGTTWKGIYLFYYPSSWTSLNVPYLEVYSSSIYADATFKIYDLNTNTEIDSIAINIVTGYNKIPLNFSQLPRANSPLRIFIGYDSSLISLVKSNPNYLLGYGGYEECPDANHHGYGEISVQDIEISSPFIYSNIIGGIGSGISLTYNLECSLEAFICSQKHLFKYAWAKLLVAEIYRETLDSDRTNIFTTLMEDRASQEMERAMSDFNSSIGDVLESMNVPGDGVCFECNEQTKAVYGRP